MAAAIAVLAAPDAKVTMPPMHGDPWLLSGPFWTDWVLAAPDDCACQVAN